MFNKIKSPETLFSETLKPEITLLSLNKNILYITHKVDKILVILTTIQNESKLQTQVTDYYDLKETSPQTESDEQ